MSTLEQASPIKKNNYGAEQSISVASGGTSYSDFIFPSSKKSFASVEFETTYTGNASIAVSVVYGSRRGSEYVSDAVSLGTITGTDETKLHLFRLDALLGTNWHPNVPLKYKFVDSGLGGTASIKGAHYV